MQPVGISFHRVNASVRGARSGCDNRPGFRREAINPITRQDRLAGGLIRAESRPISFALVFFVGDRTFHHQDERREFSFRGLMKMAHEFFAVVVSKKRIVQVNFGDPGDATEEDVFNARLSGRGHRDGVSIAAEAGGDPKNVNFSYRVCG